MHNIVICEEIYVDNNRNIISKLPDDVSHRGNICIKHMQSVTHTGESNKNDAHLNVAVTRNNAIKYAKELGADYIFFINSECDYINPSVFAKYIEYATHFNLGVVFHPCEYRRNMAFHTDRAFMEMYCQRIGHIQIFRMMSDVFFMVDLTKDIPLFNEALTSLFFDDFIIRNYNKGNIPFFGAFLAPTETTRMVKLNRHYRRVRDVEREGVELNMINKIPYTQDLNAVCEYIKGFDR